MKSKIALILAFVILITTSCAFAFTDVKVDDWYYENVTEMANSNLILGYEDGSFRPESTISYAEYITIIKRCKTGTNESAKDWPKEPMQYAYNNGWYDYDEIYESDYHKPITRQMAVKILAIAFDIPQNEQEDNAYYYYMTNINDFDSIPGRYAYLVVRAYKNGILTGDPSGNFNPLNNLTRAEACAIITRASGSVTSKPAPTALPIANTPGGVSENGALWVNGTQLTTQNGQPIVLRGMSSHGLHWFGNFTSVDSILATKNFGANLFRVAMYTGENGYISNKQTVLNNLYSAVDNAIACDMYVIIDWHILSDGDPLTYANDAAEFFGVVSSRYANTPNVIYEICNEPNGNVSWLGNVKPYAEQIIPIIRQNSNGIILVGSPTWSQDVDAAADSPLAFDNIMYTCHFYAGTHGDGLRNKIDYALSKGAPIFISEWGTSAADGNGGVYLDSSAVWLDFLESRNISWANWSLCDKAETSAALNPGTSPSNVTYDSLSESGKFVFSKFK